MEKVEEKMKGMWIWLAGCIRKMPVLSQMVDSFKTLFSFLSVILFLPLEIFEPHLI